MTATAPSTPPRLRISLPEIARLARVQRPVVSVWRRRSAGTGTPFPVPVRRENGQDWFDVAAVVDWLEATGRGNNPDLRQDAAAFADPDWESFPGDGAQFAGLTALLCLSVIAGGPLGDRTTGDLLDLADEADPDDEFLYRELAALGSRLTPLAQYADRLVDASYHAAAAFEKLMGERFRRHVPGHSAVALSVTAQRLVAGTALALAEQRRLDDPVFVDPTMGGSDLLVDVARQAEGAVLVATAPGDDPASRLARRRLRVHGLLRVALEPDGSGGYVIPDGAVVIGQFPSPGAPDMTDLQILQATGAVALQTTGDHRVVLIGPASALTDALPGQAERRERDDLLRTDRLRALVRLPPRLAPSEARRHLALAVVGPKAAIAQPDQRTIMIGDLSNATLDGPAVQQLITDLVAAVDDSLGGHGHRYDFIRPVLARDLRAQRGSLMAGAASTGRRRDAAALALEIGDAAREIATPIPTVALPRVEACPTANRHSPATTLGEAAGRREIRVLPGHRIDPADLSGGGGTAVIGTDELQGLAPVGRRVIDPLVFASRYPAGRYTEPGDVIFCTSPRPAALVDIEGGSVVCYPSRVARIDRNRSRGLSPRVLAADIGAVPIGGRFWRGWRISRTPDGQIEHLESCLVDIDRARAALSERMGQLAALAGLLTEGVTSGSIALAPTGDDKSVGVGGSTVVVAGHDRPCDAPATRASPPPTRSRTHRSTPEGH